MKILEYSEEIFEDNKKLFLFENLSWDPSLFRDTNAMELIYNIRDENTKYNNLYDF